MTQRPIKFRAWDPKQKEFYFPPALNEFDEEDGRFFAEYASRTIFQQFTGLHDKNGKDVFEGDIVSFPDTESEHVDVGVGMAKVAETATSGWGQVVMENAAWGIAVEGRPETLNSGFNSFEYITKDYGFEMSELEVIGNIYEHSHLLDSK